jgi:aryl-alcohol dehydrogenase-like predicted oxidoreductase
MTPIVLRTTELGTTGLEITRVGFGAWAIGGGGYDYRKMTRTRSRRSTTRSASA